MNIVFIITDVNYCGGGERVLITLANFFVNKFNWNIIIISLLKTNKINIYNLDKRIKIIYGQDLKNLNKFRFIKGIQKILILIKIYYLLKKIDKKQQINTIIGIGFENSWYLSLLKFKKNISLIGTQHTNYIDFSNKNSLEKLIWKFLLKKLDKFIVLTTDAKNYFQDKLRINNVIKIPNPNPYKIFNKNYKKEKIVICVGRLSQEKQMHKLIKIWNNLPENHKKDWKLYIIGDGEEKSMLIKEIENRQLQDNIYLLGKIENIHEIYKKSSIIISTSYSESFSMVLIEASSFKVCPIFYDCPTGPRNIIKNNINGFLIELNNEEKMQKKLQELMENEKLREKISFNAIENAKKYSIERICKKWKKILKD